MNLVGENTQQADWYQFNIKCNSILKGPFTGQPSHSRHRTSVLREAHSLPSALLSNVSNLLPHRTVYTEGARDTPNLPPPQVCLSPAAATRWLSSRYAERSPCSNPKPPSACVPPSSLSSGQGHTPAMFPPHCNTPITFNLSLSQQTKTKPSPSRYHSLSPLLYNKPMTCEYASSASHLPPPQLSTPPTQPSKLTHTPPC